MNWTAWLPPLVLALASATTVAHAADPIYKCKDADGKVTYSQNPCYGENWQRFGASAEAQRKPQPQPASAKTPAPPTPPDKAVRQPEPEKAAPAS